MISLFPRPLDDRSSFDPIDLQLDRSGATSQRLGARVQPGARHLPAAAYPGLVLLVGIAMGPRGLSLITPAMLQSFEPLSAVALAVLGVIAGLSTPISAVRRRPAIVAVITGVFMLGAFLVIGTAEAPRDAVGVWPLGAIILAIAASASSSLSSNETESDAIMPILAAGVAIATIAAAATVASLPLLAESAALALGAATVGWLLLSRGGTTSDQRVFGFASVLLLGGIADYTSSSALLAGVVGGFAWRSIGGAVRDDVQRDMAYVQHPVIVLVLVAAGSRADFSAQTWWLTAFYVLTRTAGKVAGEHVTASMFVSTSRHSRLDLVAPGIFAVALTLDVLRAGGDLFAPLLSAAVVGTIVLSMMVAVLPAADAE